VTAQHVSRNAKNRADESIFFAVLRDLLFKRGDGAPIKP
jgi:hypothetical protein